MESMRDVKMSEMERVTNYDPDVKTVRTRKNIYRKLKAHLQKVYGKGNCVNDILKIQGIDAKHLDPVSQIENAMLNRVRENSIDDNANKNSKHTETIMQENFNPIRKLVGFDLLYRSLKDLVGYEKANELSMEMYDYTLALHDSTKIEKVYCWALPTTFLITEGREFSEVLPSTPAKRLDSYIAGCCEVVHQLANHLAGAIAVSSLFLDVTAILKCYKGLHGTPITLDELKNNKTIRKEIENEFQQFVHSVNALTRNSIESPFTNVTVSDEIKLKKMVEDYQWLFVTPDDDFYEVDEIVEYALEVQKIFIEFFDRGIPAKGGMNYRFPVVTNALSKNDDGNLYQTEWFKWITDNADITRYNNFMSHGSKFCSCCRLINDDELLKAGSTVSSLANTSMAMGSIRVNTINFPRIAIMSKSVEDFFERLDKITYDCGLILKAHRNLIENLKSAGLQPFISNGTLKMERLFSTFGVIGLAECRDIIMNRFGYEGDFMKDMLERFREKTKEVAKELGFVSNIEQVPGESMSPRLATVDRILFGKERQPYPMYSNQFVPLWEEGDVFKRLSEDGKYQEILSGGGIVHLTSSEVLTPEQSRKTLSLACKLGNEHFAINATNSACENNHYVRGRHKICPECGGKIVDYYYRTVGFTVPESAMNEVRKSWEAPRRVQLQITKDIESFND
jgi:ribonucleoside-triphosphate reductase